MLPKLVISDIDGVMTDGGMYYTANGDVAKRFSVKDGWGVALLRALNIPVAIMTGEDTQIVAQRAKKLRIDRCYLGVNNKLALTSDLCNELGIKLSDVAFIGDDLNDLPLLRAVGLSGCPANTPEYVKQHVDICLSTRGGDGAFRAFVEEILSRENQIDKAIELCLSRMESKQ